MSSTSPHLRKTTALYSQPWLTISNKPKLPKQTSQNNQKTEREKTKASTKRRPNKCKKPPQTLPPTPRKRWLTSHHAIWASFQPTWSDNTETRPSTKDSRLSRQTSNWSTKKQERTNWLRCCKSTLAMSMLANASWTSARPTWSFRTCADGKNAIIS